MQKRGEFVKESLMSVGSELEKLGASNIMTRAIIENIQSWTLKLSPVLCMTDNTEHKKALNIAIKDQTKLGWHLFLRGMHAKSWNTAYLTWMK